MDGWHQKVVLGGWIGTGLVGLVVAGHLGRCSPQARGGRGEGRAAGRGRHGRAAGRGRGRGAPVPPDAAISETSEESGQEEAKAEWEAALDVSSSSGAARAALDVSSSSGAARAASSSSGAASSSGPLPPPVPPVVMAKNGVLSRAGRKLGRVAVQGFSVKRTSAQVSCSRHIRCSVWVYLDRVPDTEKLKTWVAMQNDYSSAEAHLAVFNRVVYGYDAGPTGSGRPGG